MSNSIDKIIRLCIDCEGLFRVVKSRTDDDVVALTRERFDELSEAVYLYFDALDSNDIQDAKNEEEYYDNDDAYEESSVEISEHIGIIESDIETELSVAAEIEETTEEQADCVEETVADVSNATDEAADTSEYVEYSDDTPIEVIEYEPIISVETVSEIQSVESEDDSFSEKESAEDIEPDIALNEIPSDITAQPFTEQCVELSDTTSEDRTTVERDNFTEPTDATSAIVEQNDDTVAESREPINLMRSFTLNDKFRFRRELFNGNEQDFTEAIDRLSRMLTYSDAVNYLLNDLGWDENDESVTDFLAILSDNLQDEILS